MFGGSASGLFDGQLWVSNPIHDGSKGEFEFTSQEISAVSVSKPKMIVSFQYSASLNSIMP